MMDDRFIELIARKLSGEAALEELSELDNYLLHNPEAFYYTELISQLWQEENTAFDFDVETDYLKHIARHHTEFESRQPALLEVDSLDVAESDHSYSFFTKFVFSMLLLATASAIIYFTSSTGSVKSLLVSNVKSIENKMARGSKKIIILPDGTQIWLNAGSKLSYDSSLFNKKKRIVSLSGEAFFDVTKNKEIPFIVQTNKICIKVLGTAFNVKAYPGDKFTETTLLRGSIELTVKNKPYQKIMLKSNEKLSLIDSLTEIHESIAVRKVQLQSHPGVDNEKLVIQEIQPVSLDNKEYVEEISWIDDNLVFQDESFEDLAPRMERWFNVTIEIKNPSVESFHFTGIFNKESINEALTAMQLIRPFKFKITRNHVLIN
jgi:transmembrane sensor